MSTTTHLTEESLEENDSSVVPGGGSDHVADDPASSGEDAVDSGSASPSPSPKSAKQSARSSKSSKRRSSSSSGSASSRRRTAQAAFSAYGRFAEADESLVSVAAKILGTDEDPEHMAVEVAAGESNSASLVGRLRSIAQLDDGVERVSALGELSYDTEFASAWSLMHQLGHVGRKRPSEKIKAIIELAKRLDDLDDRLVEAVELIDG